MLIALLQNNQNQAGLVVPATERPPTVFVDRGGGGPIGPRYDIVDILGAIETFQEVPGEHPVARAARRTRHLQWHLESLRDARERREGAAFLAGATIAQAAAQEQIDALFLQQAAVQRAQDELQERFAAMQAEKARGGGSGIGTGGALLLLAAGVAIGLAIARKRK